MSEDLELTGEQEAKPKGRGPQITLRCTHCAKRYEGHEGSTHCGSQVCTAVVEWDHDRWMGQARMADARVATGGVLDSLDRLALRRRDGTSD